MIQRYARFFCLSKRLGKFVCDFFFKKHFVLCLLALWGCITFAEFDENIELRHMVEEIENVVLYEG